MDYSVNGEILDIVKEENDLGVLPDEELECHRHAEWKRDQT